ncbi:DUF4034 domain-containing protein [Pseudomonas sp. gcc21]|uniref:DUF4034 domain-containing protein n=1 Tax=Pseudomonas sp. gcc21 TaxID=2726989 RepID=UPI0014518CE6|nr:DUF4034 domain-containing protein [Pseudomonas sp. gcc21]QJD59350.1 DUF4034 domain-containing protein [Pseudomonas sp. gcc21]
MNAINKQLCYLCLACSSLLAPVTALSDELGERRAIYDSVTRDLQNADFAHLEALAEQYRTNRERSPSGVWKLSALDAGIRSMFDPSIRDPAYWAYLDDYIGDWLKQYPRSPTAHLARASMLIHQAWSYRGTGPTESVKEEDWQPFNEHIERARLALEQSKQIAARDPQWYVTMAVVAKSQYWPDERFEDMLDEALSRYPDYYPIYYAAVDYYSPKWNGSADAIEQFAMDAMQRTRDSEGSGLYARLYWHAAQIQFDDRLIKDSRINWAVMKEGIDDVLERYPDQWNINNFARISCSAEDKRKAQELLQRIEAPIEQAWGDLDEHARCQRWAAAAEPVAAR